MLSVLRVPYWAENELCVACALIGQEFIVCHVCPPFRVAQTTINHIWCRKQQLVTTGEVKVGLHSVANVDLVRHSVLLALYCLLYFLGTRTNVNHIS